MQTSMIILLGIEEFYVFSLEHIEQFDIYFLKVLILLKELPYALIIQAP